MHGDAAVGNVVIISRHSIKTSNSDWCFQRQTGGLKPHAKWFSARVLLLNFSHFRCFFFRVQFNTWTLRFHVNPFNPFAACRIIVYFCSGKRKKRGKIELIKKDLSPNVVGAAVAAGTRLSKAVTQHNAYGQGWMTFFVCLDIDLKHAQKYLPSQCIRLALKNDGQQANIEIESIFRMLIVRFVLIQCRTLSFFWFIFSVCLCTDQTNLIVKLFTCC